MATNGSNNTVGLVADIVSAYVSNNSLPSSDLGNLIGDVHAVVVKLVDNPVQAAPTEPPKPAVPIKKSITDEYLVCLEDGRKFKSLKRHLRTRYNLTPEQYRAKWQLPPDYPMVAPGYAQTRSRMAKDMGLGQQRRGKSKK
jgi:predicted transcriptional regulator